MLNCLWDESFHCFSGASRPDSISALAVQTDAQKARAGTAPPSRPAQREREREQAVVRPTLPLPLRSAGPIRHPRTCLRDRIRRRSATTRKPKVESARQRSESDSRTLNGHRSAAADRRDRRWRRATRLRHGSIRVGSGSDTDGRTKETTLNPQARRRSVCA